MHHVQDLIIAVGSLVFIAALIPMTISIHKPVLSSSVPTSLVLFTFAGVYVSLHLWYAATTTFITGVLWAIIAAQRIVQNKKNSES